MADGTYGQNVRMEDVADDAAYAAAEREFNDPEYVSEMLDGRGYIFIQTSTGMVTYQQDSL